MKLYIYKSDKSDTSAFAHEKLKEILQNDFNYQLTKLSYNKYKKPYLINSNLFFNISHSKDIVVIAIDTSELGIDIEFYDRYEEKNINKIFSEKEVQQIKESTNPYKEYSKLWCMKESLLKCIGTGIKIDMRNVLDNTDDFIFEIIEKEAYLISVCKRK